MKPKYKYKKLDFTKTNFWLVYGKETAFADPDLNLIVCSEDQLTLETLIHEINELVIIDILKRWNIPNKRIVMIWRGKHRKFIDIEDVYPRYVSHLLSPHGQGSLINPYSENNKEEKLMDTENRKVFKKEMRIIQ